MNTAFPKQGGCHCGAVRYTLLAAPISLQHCHCSQCRKGFGALFVQGAVVRRSHLSISGQAGLTTYESSPGFTYHFCRTCGCRLFAYEAGESDLMYFMPATLDGGVHPGHPPERESHTFVASRAEWDHSTDHLPRHDGSSPDEIVTNMMRAAQDS